MGRRAENWVSHLDPSAGAEQLIAARAHHLRRWTRPRGDYPEGRAGYLRWRADAKSAHAGELAGILRGEGAPELSVDLAASLVRKDSLRTDPRAQTHEDAICLTFLEAQLDQTADRLGDDAIVGVLVKTMRKMSPAGLASARHLDLGTRSESLVGRAAAELKES